MPANVLHRLIALGRAAAHGFHRRLLAATRPTIAPLVVGTLADMARSKSALGAEHALLRHQLAILRPLCAAQLHAAQLHRRGARGRRSGRCYARRVG